MRPGSAGIAPLAASAAVDSVAPEAPAPPTRTSYLGLLRGHPHLRNLWMGLWVSNAGDWFNTIALYQAVQSLSSSALAITSVMVAKTLPVFVIAPLAGPLVDRFDRRHLLLAANGFRALCALALIAAYATGALWGLYAALVLMMCATGIAVPAKNAALPVVVPRPLVPMANALLAGSWSIMLALGAAIGGLATEALGVTAAFAIDAATFALSAVFFWRLPALPAPARTAGAPRAGFIAGVRYLLGHRYILALAGLKAMMQLYGGMIALVPLFGLVVFPGISGPIYVGLLYGLRGVGAAIGALVLRAIFGDSIRALRRTIWGCYLLAGVVHAGLALCSEFWQACALYLLSGMTQAAVWVSSGSLLQLEADRAVHGRVFAVEFGTSMLVLSLSSLVAGAALDIGFSIAAVCAGFSVMALVPLTVWSAVLWRLRRGPGA